MTPEDRQRITDLVTVYSHPEKFSASTPDEATIQAIERLLAAYDAAEAARIAELEGLLESARRICEANDKLAWAIVDIMEPGARGVSPLHFIQQQVSELVAARRAEEGADL